MGIDQGQRQGIGGTSGIARRVDRPCHADGEYVGEKMQEHTLRTDFLDFCLEHMASVGEPPGVQALCMKLAFRMCQFYPELSEELRRTLESMDADSYKPAVVSLIKKILSGKYR